MKQIDYSRNCINDCIRRFDENEQLKEELLREAFSDNPNTDLKAVLLRVTLLNTFYSTRLNNNRKDKRKDSTSKTHIDVESMARHIASKQELDSWIDSENEDERLKAFDWIASEKSEYKTDAHYAASSFASKYCSWCNPEKYPIMDSYSRGMLYHINADQNSHFYSGRLSQDSLRDYEVFCKAHKAFKEFLQRKHGGKEYSTKDIDKYLWLYGTEHPEVAIE